MPITKGAGNPDWCWDETLLALDLLYAMGALDRHHPEVIALSHLLRGAAIHPIAKRKDNFRNADGVALKLQNLLSAIDPLRGLTSSITDRKAVEEFPQSKKAELATLCVAIRAALNSGKDLGDIGDVDENETFVEGKVLTARHRSRDRRMRKRLLAKHSDDALKCEICAFSPPIKLPRTLRESFFEAHHIVPLAMDKGGRDSKLSDVVLLCASCHRFVHRLSITDKAWRTPAEARVALHANYAIAGGPAVAYATGMDV